jgi:cell division protease FtsH
MKPRRSEKPPDPRSLLPILLYGTTLVLLFFLFGRILGATPAHRSVDYSEFKTLLRKGAIERVVIVDGTLRGEGPLVAPAGSDATVAPGTPQATSNARDRVVYISRQVEDPGLIALLEARGIPYAAEPDGFHLAPILVQAVLPLVLLLALWRFLFRGAGPGAALSFGRSRAKLVATEDVGVAFADVAGVDEAKEELAEVVEFLQHPSRFTAIGARIPKGVLLVGPPGTGKTLLARAVAGEAKVPFFSLTGSDFVEMFVGVGAARVRDLFAQAQTKAPCIIFIDELDAVGKARGATIVANEEREQTLNQLLAEMDGFDPRKGVIIMAATNRPETIDPALLRPGRFDRQILVDRPDINGREAILRVHARGVRLAENVDLHAIAAATPGFAGADLANVLNEAALLAVRRRKEAVDAKDLADAIERIVAGLEKKNRIMSPDEKRRVAYHEAGHALVGARLTPRTPVRKISIIPRGVGALGYTLQVPLEDRYLMTREELCAKLAIFLGGRAAEELCFGSASTGASDDLQRANDMASRMVREYGLSERLGPRAFDHEVAPLLPPVRGGTRVIPYSEKTAEIIDAEIAALVDEAQRQARAILEAERPQLERLATTLLDREALEGADLERLLAPPKRPAPISRFQQAKALVATRNAPG